MFMGIQIEGRVWEVWLISVIIFVITGLILYQRKRSFSYLFLSIFWIYSTFIVDSVFFRWLLVGLLLKLAGGHARCRPINLAPLYFGPYLDAGRVFLYGMQNIILTIPLDLA